MTNKDAINQLRDLIRDRKSRIMIEEYTDIYRRDIDALEIGVSAIDRVNNIKSAHWDINCDGFYPFCSNCKKTPTAHNLTRYCSYCGAKMVMRT